MQEPRYPNTTYPAKEADRKEWFKTWAKGVFTDFENNGEKIFYNNRTALQQNRLYALGKQSTDQYKRQLDMDELGDNGESKALWVNLDWSILKVVPYYRQIVVNKLLKTQYRTSVDAFDSLSLTKKQRLKDEMAAKLFLQPVITEQPIPGMNPLQMGSPSGLEQEFAMPAEQPQDNDELELFNQMPPKLRTEVALENFTNLTLYENDWQLIRKQYCEDLVDTGFSLTKDYIDGNGYIRLRRVLPENFIVGYSNRPDFKNSPFFGEMIPVSWNELRTDPNAKFTEDEWQTINSQLSGSKHCSFTPSTSPDKQFMVLDVEWIAENYLVTEKKQNQYGNSTTHVKALDYKAPVKSKFKREVERTPYRVICKAKWIVGTEFIYDFGLATDMKRDNKDLASTQSSFHVYKLDNCVMDSLKTLADSIQIKWMKAQHLIAKAIPKGIAVEKSALENVLDGESPQSMLRLYTHTGSLVFRRQDDDGQRFNDDPIKPLENGMSGDVSNFINLINSDIAMIETITGVNRIAAAQAPKSSDLNGTSQIALQGTENALFHIYDADRIIYESTAKAIVLRLPDALKVPHVKEYYSKALGEIADKFIVTDLDFSSCTFKVRAEALPNEAELAELKGLVANALAIRQQSGTGGITLADALKIQDMMKESVKMAQQYLVLREKKQRQIDDETAQRNTEMNMQQQMASNQQAAQAKQEELTLELTLKDQFAAKAEERKRETMMLALDLKLKEIEAQGTIKAQHIDLKGDIDRELLDEQATMLDDRQEHIYENKEKLKAGEDIGS